MTRKNNYRILITGSRDWDDEGKIKFALAEAAKASAGYDDIVIVSGACPTGADLLCEIEAFRLGWQVERHPANWKLYAKRAGFIRNKNMVQMGANVCIAFIKNASKGASHTAGLAQEAGIATTIYREVMA